MNKETKEVLLGCMSIVLLPWAAILEWISGRQPTDFRGRKRGIASAGLLKVLAFISFIIQVLILFLILR